MGNGAVLGGVASPPIPTVPESPWLSSSSSPAGKIWSLLLLLLLLEDEPLWSELFDLFVPDDIESKWRFAGGVKQSRVEETGAVSMTASRACCQSAPGGISQTSSHTRRPRARRASPRRSTVS